MPSRTLVLEEYPAQGRPLVSTTVWLTDPRWLNEVEKTQVAFLPHHLSAHLGTCHCGQQPDGPWTGSQGRKLGSSTSWKGLTRERREFPHPQDVQTAGAWICRSVQEEDCALRKLRTLSFSSLTLAHESWYHWQAVVRRLRAQLNGHFFFSCKLIDMHSDLTVPVPVCGALCEQSHHQRGQRNLSSKILTSIQHPIIHGSLYHMHCKRDSFFFFNDPFLGN